MFGVRTMQERTDPIFLNKKKEKRADLSSYPGSNDPAIGVTKFSRDRPDVAVEVSCSKYRQAGVTGRVRVCFIQVFNTVTSLCRSPGGWRGSSVAAGARATAKLVNLG